jgi:hypothetical protein
VPDRGAGRHRLAAASFTIDQAVARLEASLASVR